MARNKKVDKPLVSITVAIVPAIIAALAGIVGAYFSYSAGVAAIRIPLIATQTAEAKQTPTIQTVVITQPPFTVTQIVQVTPTPNGNILLINSVPSRVFPFVGGNDSQVQGLGILSVSYDEEGEQNYTLDYSLPDQGFTWAGTAMVFNQSMNLAQHQYLEVAIKFSDPQVRCEIKLVDQSDNTAIFRLGDSPPPNTGVVVHVDGDRQVYKIPLRGNFDSVNLEQVKEVSFSTNSNLGTGSHYFTVSRIKLLEE